MALITKHIRQSYVIAIGLVIVLTCLLSAGFIEIYLRCFLEEPEIMIRSNGGGGMNGIKDGNQSSTGGGVSSIPPNPKSNPNPRKNSVDTTDTSTKNPETIQDNTPPLTNTTTVIPEEDKEEDKDIIVEEEDKDITEEEDKDDILFISTNNVSPNDKINSSNNSLPLADNIMQEDDEEEEDISGDLTSNSSSIELQDTYATELLYDSEPAIISTLDDATARTLSLRARFISLDISHSLEKSKEIINILIKYAKANPFINIDGRFSDYDTNDVDAAVDYWNLACESARRETGQLSLLRLSAKTILTNQNYPLIELPLTESFYMEKTLLPLIGAKILNQTFDSQSQQDALDLIVGWIKTLEDRVKASFVRFDNLISNNTLISEVKDKLLVAINYYNQLVVETDPVLHPQIAAELSLSQKKIGSV